jgi:hypothetical protein
VAWSAQRNPTFVNFDLVIININFVKIPAFHDILVLKCKTFKVESILFICA